MKTVTQTEAQRDLFKLIRELGESGPVKIRRGCKGVVAALIPVAGDFHSITVKGAPDYDVEAD